MSTPSTNFRGPIYFLIQQNILEQIQQGVLQPGQQLPTEAVLAQQYQVSRITAKRALDELVRMGRAYRQQGKGTFVAQTRIREISGFGSFSADMRARGLLPTSQILSFHETQPDEDICARLKLAPGEAAFHLERLRLANGEPMAVEIAYLPVKICPRLGQEDLSNQSLYAILADKFQVVPTWADAEIEARMASTEETSLLKMPVGMPVLIAHRITFSANYEVIETVDSVYRSDRFTFYSGRQYIEFVK